MHENHDSACVIFFNKIVVQETNLVICSYHAHLHPSVGPIAKGDLSIEPKVFKLGENSTR